MFVDQLLQERPAESAELEYNAVVPPPRVIARFISAFANTQGGTLVLGVDNERNLVGLAAGVPAAAMVDIAVSQVTPRPPVNHYGRAVDSRQLYIVEIGRSPAPVALSDGAVYFREGAQVRRKPREIAGLSGRNGHADESFITQLERGIPPVGQQLEYAAAIPSPLDLARIIASFANANGGRLVLGIDPTGKIVGLTEDAEARSKVEEALTYIRPRPDTAHYSAQLGTQRIYIVEVADSGTLVATQEPVIYVRKDGKIVRGNDDGVAHAEVQETYRLIAELRQRLESGMDHDY